MAELVQYAVWVPTLVLVIFRVAGIFLTAPILSDATIPPQVKILLSVILGLAATARLSAPVAMPNSWADLVMAVGGEMLIGAVIGYAAGLLLLGVEMAAEQIAQQMGIALASVFNPTIEDTTNVLGTLFDMTALAIFLLIGGHRLMIGGLMDTLQRVPLAGFSANMALLDAVVAMLTAALVLSMKVAAPALIALFLASVAMGFVQRTMPQLNILSVGFQVRIMLALMVLAVSLVAFVPLLETAWKLILQQLAKVF